MPMTTVGLVHLNKFRKSHVNLAEQRAHGAAERLPGHEKVAKYLQAALVREYRSGGRSSRRNSHSRWMIVVMARMMVVELHLRTRPGIIVRTIIRVVVRMR